MSSGIPAWVYTKQQRIYQTPVRIMVVGHRSPCSALLSPIAKGFSFNFLSGMKQEPTNTKISGINYPIALSYNEDPLDATVEEQNAILVVYSLWDFQTLKLALNNWVPAILTSQVPFFLVGADVPGPRGNLGVCTDDTSRVVKILKDCRLITPEAKSRNFSDFVFQTVLQEVIRNSQAFVAAKKTSPRQPSSEKVQKKLKKINKLLMELEKKAKAPPPVENDSILSPSIIKKSRSAGVINGTVGSNLHHGYVSDPNIKTQLSSRDTHESSDFDSSRSDIKRHTTEEEDTREEHKTEEKARSNSLPSTVGGPVKVRVYRLQDSIPTSGTPLNDTPQKIVRLEVPPKEDRPIRSASAPAFHAPSNPLKSLLVVHGLEGYFDALCKNGFKTVEDLREIQTAEELSEVANAIGMNLLEKIKLGKIVNAPSEQQK